MATTSSDSSSAGYHCYQYRDLDRAASLFRFVNEMRDINALCDVSLRVGDTVTRAHRVVLASSSPYFRAMFTGDMAEKSQSEVELHDVDSDAVQSLVEFLYTGRVMITEENAPKLLSTSTFLQVDSVRDACSEFLTENLSSTNCLALWRLAETNCCCEELSRMSRDSALQNFEAVAKSQEFLSLSATEIEDLVSDDKLCVVSEDRVFEAVTRWIKHDLAQRSQHIARLMGHMRLPQMSKSFLFDTVYKDPLVRTDPGSKDLLLAAMMYRQCPERECEFSDERPWLTQRRTGCLVPYVFAIGGVIGCTASDSGECYDPGNDRWLSIAPMSRARSNAGIVSLDKLIYACGGFSGHESLSSAECYDPIVNEWSAIASMRSKRGELGVGVVNGLLYACGGFDGSTYVSTVERYDPLTGVWSRCPGMTTARGDGCVCTVDNCLYAAGGRSRTGHLSAVERYDPRTGGWTAVADMSVRRFSFGAAAPDRCTLYCVGGSLDCDTCLSGGERFDVRRNAWEPIADMQRRRRKQAVVAVDGGLLVLGGDCGHPLLNSNERYDPPTDRWTTPATPPPTAACRRALGVTLLYCSSDTGSKL